MNIGVGGSVVSRSPPKTPHKQHIIFLLHSWECKNYHRFHFSIIWPKPWPTMAQHLPQILLKGRCGWWALWLWSCAADCWFFLYIFMQTITMAVLFFRSSKLASVLTKPSKQQIIAVANSIYIGVWKQSETALCFLRKRGQWLFLTVLQSATLTQQHPA